jgi:serine/threonine protein kinase
MTALYNKFCFSKRLVWKRDQVLGHGRFATVYKGKFKSVPVAVKRLKSELISDDFYHLVDQLQHPNIVKFHHWKVHGAYRYRSKLMTFLKMNSMNFKLKVYWSWNCTREL